MSNLFATYILAPFDGPLMQLIISVTDEIIDVQLRPLGTQGVSVSYYLNMESGRESVYLDFGETVSSNNDSVIEFILDLIEMVAKYSIVVQEFVEEY